MALSAANARNEVMAGLAGGSDRVVIDKASMSNAVANTLHSLWRATGVPGQGAIPGAAAACTKALAGAMAFTNQTAPVTNYLAWGWIATAGVGATCEWHDRLAHMGGLSGTVTTAQGALTLTGVSAERIGATDYSDVQWGLEWYTDTGSTGVNATVNVTWNDDTTGNLAAIALSATSRAGRFYPLISNVAGKFIKAVNSVTLSATTGTAGNFGITATRSKCVMYNTIANQPKEFDWAALGLPHFPNDACIFLLMNTTTTSTGIVRGHGKIIHV